ncbi:MULTISPECIES: HAD family hydrolase [Kitasatospora]|uniref:Putative phosphatase n=1 Tax=Kitasatospora setae (strain ATCC 33774 / DSM 43861 / JCM 3304 / KCC A-0304 / NBRC 14216 / KM-6054) TaxID=452652 RepID=E4NDA6_KITSK|nr:HAD family hydrolase [Kitasatospora setae]BAJ29187.1 putative phosphatase [Kitasatospora setae KM-6054]
MSYDLLILDNDGVLVDSEPISNRVLAEYLTELGYPTSTEDSYRDFMGTAAHTVHDVIAERYGAKLPDGFDDLFHDRVFAAFEAELRPVAGAAELLGHLREQGLRYCVASSAHHSWIRTAHRLTGLSGYFTDDLLFSAQDVGVGKPAPDLFLHAARTMGVDPARCLVLEDSRNGVLAARAAGMDVYGYAALTDPAKLTSAGATGLLGALPDAIALLPN